MAGSIRISRELAENALKKLKLDNVDPKQWSSEPTVYKLDNHSITVKSTTKGRVTISYKELPEQTIDKLLDVIATELGI